MNNLKEMKLGFKKAYFSLNNQDKKSLINQLVNTELDIVSEKQISSYLKENKIYKETVLTTILGWESTEIYKTFVSKRNKEINMISEDLTDVDLIDKFLSTFNQNVFNHFYQSFS